MNLSSSQNNQQLVMGAMLPSVKTPFRYFGGKVLATQHLIKYVPRGITEAVSPFFGGGSLELGMTARGIRIYGYDLFSPLVNLWQCLLNQPHNLERKTREVINTFGTDSSALRAYCKEYLTVTNPLDSAHRLLIMLNFCFNGNLRSGFSQYLIQDNGDAVQSNYRNKRLVKYELVRNFYNPLISIEHADFRESLARHPNMFAYCDPPYPEAYASYGNDRRYDEDFPHEELADILHRRQSDWMLSYNNCATVKNLYPENEFDYTYPKWSQGSKALPSPDHCNEVLIRPRREPLSCN